MHPLMGAVLLWATGMDPLVLDAEAHPPHIQIRQPVNRLRREGHAVVGADGTW